MKDLKIASQAVIIFTLLFIAGCIATATRPVVNWAGYHMDTRTGNPMLGIHLSNTNSQPMYTKVTINSPQGEEICEKSLVLESRKTYRISCAEDNIVTDAEYIISVTTYEDPNYLKLIDQSKVPLKFNKNDMVEAERMMKEMMNKHNIK